MKLLRLIQVYHAASVAAAIGAPFLVDFCLAQADDMRLIPLGSLLIFQVAIAIIITWESVQNISQHNVSLLDKLYIQTLFWTCGMIPLVFTGTSVLYAFSILVPPR